MCHWWKLGKITPNEVPYVGQEVADGMTNQHLRITPDVHRSNEGDALPLLGSGTVLMYPVFDDELDEAARDWTDYDGSWGAVTCQRLQKIPAANFRRWSGASTSF